MCSARLRGDRRILLPRMPFREDVLRLAQELLQEDARLVDEGEVPRIGHDVHLRINDAA